VRAAAKSVESGTGDGKAKVVRSVIDGVDKKGGVNAPNSGVPSAEKRLMREYSAACSSGDLRRAIRSARELVKSEAGAKLSRKLNRKAFFDAAAERRNSWAAIKLLTVLPEDCCDIRTFNSALR